MSTFLTRQMMSGFIEPRRSAFGCLGNCRIPVHLAALPSSPLRTREVEEVNGPVRDYQQVSVYRAQPENGLTLAKGAPPALGMDQQALGPRGLAGGHVLETVTVEVRDR
jgi:hypothetical protein